RLDRQAYLDHLEGIRVLQDAVEGNCCRRGRPLDEGAAALTARDATFLLQHVQGTPQRSPAAAQFARQHAPGRNAAVGSESLLPDQLTKPRERLFGSFHHPHPSPTMRPSERTPIARPTIGPVLLVPQWFRTSSGLFLSPVIPPRKRGSRGSDETW